MEQETKMKNEFDENRKIYSINIGKKMIQTNENDMLIDRQINNNTIKIFESLHYKLTQKICWIFNVVQYQLI